MRPLTTSFQFNSQGAACNKKLIAKQSTAKPTTNTAGAANRSPLTALTRSAIQLPEDWVPDRQPDPDLRTKSSGIGT
jgi:hypothetical protein